MEEEMQNSEFQNSQNTTLPLSPILLALNIVILSGSFIWFIANPGFEPLLATAIALIGFGYLKIFSRSLLSDMVYAILVAMLFGIGLTYVLLGPNLETPVEVTSTPVVESDTVSGSGNFIIEDDADINNSPFVVNPSGDVTIIQNAPLPTPKSTSILNVDGLTTTSICIEIDDILFVRASGGIVVGQFVGSVGPDGTDSGVFDLSLDSYDLYPQFPHGALLCKLDSETDWRACKSTADFAAQAAGCLQFNINDNEQKNNSGFFEVKVDVFDN